MDEALSIQARKHTRKRRRYTEYGVSCMIKARAEKKQTNEFKDIEGQGYIPKQKVENKKSVGFKNVEVLTVLFSIRW